MTSYLAIQVADNAAWAVFDWAFTAKLANGQRFTSKGWESHRLLPRPEVSSYLYTKDPTT